MRLRLDYGTSGLDVDLPDDRVTVIEPMPRPAAPDPRETLVRAIRAPIDRPPLRELWKPGRRVAISVCDITRAQPRRETIEALFSEMPGVRHEDVSHWILHSGGEKVISAVESALAVAPRYFASARSVLRKYGNMSSPSVLFVLAEEDEWNPPRPGDCAATARRAAAQAGWSPFCRAAR